MDRGYLVFLCCSLALVSSSCTNPNASASIPQDEIAGRRVVRSLKEPQITRVLFQDTAGRYWCTSGISLAAYDEVTNRWTHYSQENGAPLWPDALRVVEGPGQTIWATSSGRERDLRYFDGSRWKAFDLVDFPALSGKVRGFASGHGKRLWAICDRGLTAFDGRRFSELVPTTKAMNDAYRQLQSAYLMEHEAFGLSRSRIAEIRAAAGEDPTLFDNPLSEIISCLVDADGHIWLGTERAILEYDEATKRWDIGPLPKALNEVATIYRDREGRIWFGDYQGHLAVHDRKKGSWVSHNLSGQRSTGHGEDLQLRAIYQDKSRRMMFATQEGLMTLAEKENRWEVVTSRNSRLPGDDVTSIVEDGGGRIWIATLQGIVVLQ